MQSAFHLPFAGFRVQAPLDGYSGGFAHGFLQPLYPVSHLFEEQQYTLLEAMEYNDATPSLAQAIKMKKYNQDGKLNSEVIQSIMEEEKPNQKEKPAFRDERITKLIPKTVPRSDKKPQPQDEKQSAFHLPFAGFREQAPLDGYTSEFDCGFLQPFRQV